MITLSSIFFGVAGAALQTASPLIKWIINPLPKYCLKHRHTLMVKVSYLKPWKQIILLGHSKSIRILKLQYWFKSYRNLKWGLANRWFWKGVKLPQGGSVANGATPSSFIPGNDALFTTFFLYIFFINAIWLCSKLEYVNCSNHTFTCSISTGPHLPGVVWTFACLCLALVYCRAVHG